MKAETILRAYLAGMDQWIDGEHAVALALSKRRMTKEQLLEATAEPFRAMTRRSTLLERCEKRLSHICQEYDGMIQREKGALMVGLYARRETLA